MNEAVSKGDPVSAKFGIIVSSKQSASRGVYIVGHQAIESVEPPPDQRQH